MASTYSPNLRLELIGTGEQQGTWGSTTNTNLGTLLEEAIGGYVSVAVTDGANTTLTSNNGSADQSRNMVINLTGALTATRNVICPAIEKLYVVKNATTGGQSIVFKVSGQTGVTIPNGIIEFIYVDGTDARSITGSIAIQDANNVAITGGSISGASLSNVSVVANASSLSVRDSDASHILSIAVGSNLTANTILTLTTGATSNRTLDISASNVTISTAGAALIDDADASAQRTTLGLGTIATQNANAVSITGGSITGITDLAVADGGTGASNAASARTNLGVGTGDSPQFTGLTLTGVGAFSAGTALLPSLIPSGDTNTGVWFPAADTIAASTGGTERLRIDTNGNVGIGVTPTGVSKLEISGSGTITRFNGATGEYHGIGIRVTDASNSVSRGIFYDAVNENNIPVANMLAGVFADGSSDWSWTTTPSGSRTTDRRIERLSIESSGTLTSQPTYDNTASGSTMVVTSAGLIRRTSSSIKYKKDIEDLDSTIADNAIANLRPVWYRTKNAEGDDKAEWSHIGLIAEEVDLVEKRLVRYRTVEVSDVDVPELDADGQPVLDDEGNPKTRKKRIETVLENPEPEDVDYARLSVLLLDKVKRQDAKISALETALASLEARLVALEKA